MNINKYFKLKHLGNQNPSYARILVMFQITRGKTDNDSILSHYFIYKKIEKVIYSCIHKK